MFIIVCFFFKQKTSYEMRISDWSSDVCSSDLPVEDGWLVFWGLLRSREQQKGARQPGTCVDRKSVVSGKSVSVRVDLGGRRILKKKKNMTRIMSICTKYTRIQY